MVVAVATRHDRRIHPGSGRRRGPDQPKGRQVDPTALAEVQELLGERERRRDLLIEHLHLLQDHFGCLHARHLAALPQFTGLEPYRAAGGYLLLEACLTGGRQPEELIEILERSGLRGLGGAGFPTGRKWRLVRQEPAPRLLAVNADEGEPGTFKDRYFLETDPHRFLEGMLIAAWVVEAAEVYVYLRDEYPQCQTILEG